ncbi:MAG TPA: hypothetical protein VGX23_14335 [Actinocrinis sp.]|nr:hypothetical protein [Actinocrinis sp.]
MMAIAVTHAYVPRRAVTPSPAASWTVKWAGVVRGLHLIDAGYSGTATSPDWAAAMVQFCEDCYHLQDWIKSDPAVSPSVQAAVRPFLDSGAAPCINMAADVINTSKHRTRNRGAQARATLVELADSDAVTITVESVYDGVTTLWDGQAIARRSVAEWLTFFAAQGLRP